LLISTKGSGKVRVVAYVVLRACDREASVRLAFEKKFGRLNSGEMDMDRGTLALGIAVLVVALVAVGVYFAMGSDSRVFDSVKSAIGITDQAEETAPEATSDTEQARGRTSEKQEEKSDPSDTRE
jgi:hypothetical protein